MYKSCRRPVDCPQTVLENCVLLVITRVQRPQRGANSSCKHRARRENTVLKVMCYPVQRVIQLVHRLLYKKGTKKCNRVKIKHTIAQNSLKIKKIIHYLAHTYMFKM